MPDEPLCASAAACATGACPAATDVCSPNACASDEDCPGASCLSEIGTCFVDASTCGADEPNDRPNLARALSGTTTGSLCPGDLDWYRTGVDVDQALFVEASVDAVGFVIAGDGAFVAGLQGSGAFLPPAGEVFIVIDGSGVTDPITYELSARAESILDPRCENEAGEPNDDRGTAEPLPLGTKSLLLCPARPSGGAVDFYRFTGFGGRQPVVRLDGGDVSFLVFDESGRTLPLAPGPDGARIVAPADTIVVRAETHSIAAQRYDLTVTAGCPGDDREPDDHLLQASVLASGLASAVVCGGEDVDTYVLNLETDEGAHLTTTGAAVSFTATPLGGTVIAGLQIPASPRPTTWIVEGVAAGSAGGAYEIETTLVPGGACAANEHGLDDDPAQAPCLGTAAGAVDCAASLPASLSATATSCATDPSQPGCGTHCGVDVDLIRLGAVPPGTTIHAILESGPQLTLGLEMETAGGPVSLTTVEAGEPLHVVTSALFAGELMLAVRGPVEVSGVPWALTATTTP